MTNSIDALDRLQRACGKAAGALSDAGDDLLADLGLSTARLQVLDDLAANGPRTVPSLSRKRQMRSGPSSGGRVG